MDQKCTVVSVFISHGSLLNAFFGSNLHVQFNIFLMLDRFPSSGIESKCLSISVAIVGGCWLLILHVLLFFFPPLGTWWRSRSFYSQNVEIIDIWNRSQEDWSCEVKLSLHLRVPFQIPSFPSLKGLWIFLCLQRYLQDL